MITVAKEADLFLPEYVAFHHGQRLPQARSWAPAFVLYQCRLSDTMAVFDCTVNSGAFPDRLTELYPNTIYRHWNPLPDGQFALPSGLPDQAFDRAVCNDTLDDLTHPQQRALIRAMSRMLKPDGWLILTSRSDPTTTPQMWIDLCRPHGLYPLTEAGMKQNGADPSVESTRMPQASVPVGGVFSRLRPAVMPPSRKVVLSLLTWNTREISVESLRAYISEAQMLRRLGHLPYLCVSDNGSTDGTSFALRAIEPELDFPHRFILNPHNLGNSIARNQIIDYMLECGADYLMLMDGDIEIVPFSSFAMLRHMENSGHRLACVGADSSGHTPHRERASPYLFHISDCALKKTNYLAWTQYGMFRRAVFADGIRFEDRHPFDGGGWGFEDNDLAFQLAMNGYENEHFYGTIYLHRHLHSSFRIMRESGVDAGSVFSSRKQFLIDKWTTIPEIRDGPLTWIRRDQYPELPHS